MSQSVKILGQIIGSDNPSYYHVEIGPFDCVVYERPGKLEGERTGDWIMSIDRIIIVGPYHSAQSAADALTVQLRVIAVDIVGFSGGEVKWPS